MTNSQLSKIIIGLAHLSFSNCYWFLSGHLDLSTLDLSQKDNELVKLMSAEEWNLEKRVMYGLEPEDGQDYLELYAGWKAATEKARNHNMAKARNLIHRTGMRQFLGR